MVLAFSVPVDDPRVARERARCDAQQADNGPAAAPWDRDDPPAVRIGEGLPDHLLNREPGEFGDPCHGQPGPLVELGMHESRAERRRRDARSRQPPGNRFCEHRHIPLRGRIAAARDQGGHRGDIDDAPVYALPHGLGRGVGQDENRPAQHIQERLLVGDLRVEEAVPQSEAGVVDGTSTGRSKSATRSATRAKSARTPRSAGSACTPIPYAVRNRPAVASSRVVRGWPAGPGAGSVTVAGCGSRHGMSTPSGAASSA